MDIWRGYGDFLRDTYKFSSNSNRVRYLQIYVVQFSGASEATREEVKSAISIGAIMPPSCWSVTQEEPRKPATNPNLAEKKNKQLV